MQRFCAALFAVVQPIEQNAHDCAETDGAKNERPGYGNCQPGNDDESDRNDGPSFRSRNGHVPESQSLRLRSFSRRYSLEHLQPRKPQMSRQSNGTLTCKSETENAQSISTTDPRAAAGFASKRAVTARAIA
jgi:hypothetical protein